MDKQALRNRIVKRVAEELKPGSLVNLGIGMPTLVANHVSDDMGILFQSENGMIGIGRDAVTDDNLDVDITNAGGQPVSTVPEVSYFDSSLSFAIIRGGHVDSTVLGALEVDAEGNLANWIIPGKMVPGMGGAMDLVTGAKQVIIAMEHCNKNGEPKILQRCNLPLTAKGQVNLIVTEMAVIEVTENELLLTEIAVDTTVEQVIKATGAELKIASDLKTFGEIE
ncbi:3-oxoacid CoA-transferase subunit B [Endozoicomonas elysicola]|uniref:Acetate CoA-transferase n=1 Tax=Endozoicomonas elysicola TaxID=305900 RepID=A0A081K623_9GAMM|nr:3-oxoacid CoA-transferase subunit B [Endozoicomonas elysicola]KEI69599.1 acetate CoA-transferase [Endozoicomonas elysicola]